MNEVKTDPLEAVIRDAGEGWLIDWFAPPDQALANLRARLKAADESARRRLGASAPSLTAEAIVAEYRADPRKVRAFLQVLGSVETPDFLLLAWRILQGTTIHSIHLQYEAQRTFRLRVVLESDEEYQSDEIEDAVILRHLGTMKVGRAPVFDGFFALNVG